MTGSSQLYKWALLLYPKPFRMEFGHEMLQMFDECRKAHGFLHLLADVLVSAAKRQIDYLRVPAPKNAPLYAEVTPSPDLPRTSGIALLCVALLWTPLVLDICGGQTYWPTPCHLSGVNADATTKQNTQLGVAASAFRE